MQPSTNKPNIEMVIYLTECTLATVDDMVIKKSRPVGEFKRQKAIAQTGIDWIIAKNAQASANLRAGDVINKFGGNVNAYAQDMLTQWGRK